MELNAYQFRVNDKWVINGKTIPFFDTPLLVTESKGQFINCGIEERKVNCRLVAQFPNNEKAQQPLPYLDVVCWKDKIKLGSELFLWYGPAYWMCTSNWPHLSQKHRDHLRLNFNSEWTEYSEHYNLNH